MNKKTIIIIGATSGIGRALFEKYAADGNRIGIGDHGVGSSDLFSN